MHFHNLTPWLAILVLVAGFHAGTPQIGSALVYAEPARLEIGAGQIGTMQIMLANANKVYGIDVQATFNPAVVEVVDADSRKTGVQMVPGKFIKADYAVRNLADNHLGTLRYVVTQLNPTPPASGKGIVLLVHFRGKTAGTSSKFTIISAVIADRRGNKQAVTLQGADLVIVTPKPATPTPHPTLTLTPHLHTSIPATQTKVGTQPTVRPSLTATVNGTPTQPGAIVNEINPPVEPGMNIFPINSFRLAERNAVAPGGILMYVTVGGFSGALLLFGLAAWLLVSKRRKKLSGNQAADEADDANSGKGSEEMEAKTG